MVFDRSFGWLLCLAIVLVLLTRPAAAFGAGNIASISKIEGQNWRHGDIEDMLKTVVALRGHKWSSMMIKRVYFGNWLRDYSQAVDVGTLTKVPGATIRILVWILGFMTFGYATQEFEVTEERLGCYRPEEHIDNPKGYPENAPDLDKRLRGPVKQEELEIDMKTGMKNYIANESGGWATSSGFVKYSFRRSIHFGCMYTSGPNRGQESDLCEALRCLGQGLHCLEDFGAHTQYVELVLRELGFHDVFPHVGHATEIDLNGKRVYPLVTGTFGGVDFLHSVLGEASDHVTQSEVDDLEKSLGQARDGSRSVGGNSAELGDLTGLLGMIPGTGDLARQAEDLQRDSDRQAAYNTQAGYGGNYSSSRGGEETDRAFNPMAMMGGGSGGGVMGQVPTDPEEIVKKIYPILVFRDNVVRSINAIISKIPGLETVVDKITETVTLFVMRLIAPYIMPLIATASQGLKQGSSAVVNSSSQQQYVVFDNATATDPTHSMLSKDHFSNVLNEPAGKVASEILKYAAPRVIYAWEHPEVPVDEVVNDVVQVFHHPALRNNNIEVHRTMFSAVEQWIRSQPGGGHDVERLLTTQSVRAGKNHRAQKFPAAGIPNPFGGILGGSRELDLDDAGSAPSGGHGHGGYQQPQSQGYQEPNGGYGGNQGQPGFEAPYAQAPPGQGHGGYGGGQPGYEQAAGGYPQPMGYGQGPPGGFDGGRNDNDRRNDHVQGGYGGPQGQFGGQQGPYGGQGYPGQGHPSQGYPGQGYPGQGYPGQGYPGQGYPGSGYGQDPRY